MTEAPPAAAPAVAAARPRRARPSRRIALALLVAFVAAGTIAVRHFLAAEWLTAFLVGQARTALDADLKLGATARFGFSPRLHLALPQPRLANLAGAPLLGAESIDVVVPWHTLWSRRYDIERIELVRPVLDLDALSAWLAARPPGVAPDVRFTLHVADGTLLRGGAVVASGIDFDIANSGDLAAWLDRTRGGAAHSGNAIVDLLPPVAGTASMRSGEFGGTKVQGLRVEIRDDAAPAASSP